MKIQGSEATEDLQGQIKEDFREEEDKVYIYLRQFISYLFTKMFTRIFSVSAMLGAKDKYISYCYCCLGVHSLT